MSPILLPSKRFFYASDRALLEKMLACGFITYVPDGVTFKAGARSRVYIGGREDVTDHPDLLSMLAHRITSLIWQQPNPMARQPCLIGLPEAGKTLAVATATASADPLWRGQDRPLIACRNLRTGRKSYGRQQAWVDGMPDYDHQTYYLLDNTVTSGSTIKAAIDHLTEDGYRPLEMPVIVVVDRQSGGIENLKQAGFKSVIVMFYLHDLLHAISAWQLWQPPTIEVVLSELKPPLPLPA